MEAMITQIEEQQNIMAEMLQEIQMCIRDSRYTHASCHSYVVMKIDGKILVVNGENDAETKDCLLYTSRCV